MASGKSAREGPSRPVPVILDTDIGDDIDDTWALAFLLGRPEVDLRLVVTAFGDTQQRSRLAAKILERAGRCDIPVATGVETGGSPHNQTAWVGDWDLSCYSGEIVGDGVAALVEAVNSCPEPPVLLAIGPLTNVAAALRRDPSVAGRARLVAMAGSVHRGYGAEGPPDAEYNVRADVEAARAVLRAPWEKTLAPLDGCGDLVLAGENFRRVADSDAELSRIVVENYDAWANRGSYPVGASSVLFDTVAACLAFDESFWNVETVDLTVDDDGFTRPAERGRPVRCALGWRDRQGFEKLLVETLAPAG